MLSKQIDVLYHKLGFDYWKCVCNAKLIIKTPKLKFTFFRDLNGFHQGRGLFNMQRASVSSTKQQNSLSQITLSNPFFLMILCGFREIRK